jgi:hypothetical protein
MTDQCGVREPVGNSQTGLWPATTRPSLSISARCLPLSHVWIEGESDLLMKILEGCSRDPELATELDNG